MRSYVRGRVATKTVFGSPQTSDFLRQLVFVSTRGGGTADLWTIDLPTRRTKALTSGPGGDFRPSWSPDGRWIAFSSDRASTLPFAHGRWEHLHLVDLYIIRPDGSGLKQITEHGNFCGSPKWAADSRHVVAYCMTAEQTLANRRPVPDSGNDTRLVWIDITTGASSDVPAGAGVKMNPSPLPGNDVGYIRKDPGSAGAGIYYTSGKTGPKGDVRTAAWSPDGRRVVFHKRLTAPPPTWKKTFSRNPNYDLTLTGFLPSFNPAGDRFVMNSRPSANALGADLRVAASGADRFDVIYHDNGRNALAPQWSPRGDRIVFGAASSTRSSTAFTDCFSSQRIAPRAALRSPSSTLTAAIFMRSRQGRTTTAFRRWRLMASVSCTARSARKAMACAS